MPPVNPIRAGQLQEIAAAAGQVASRLAAAKVPAIATMLRHFAAHPELFVITRRALDIITTAPTFSPRIVGRAFEAAASEYASEKLADEWLSEIPVSRPPV